jgi:hypothetical protein
MKMFRIRVTGLADEAGNTLPHTVIVEAYGVATAKVEAATAVNGYWTEESDCEIVAVINAEEGVKYPKVVEVQQNVSILHE